MSSLRRKGLTVAIDRKLRIMNRRTALQSIGAVSLTVVAMRTATAAESSGKPSAAEQPFVAAAVASLSQRFATPQSALAAGFVRFTDEDDTGAISYANQAWTSEDAQHPSQLWYSADGRLLGADFSLPYATDRPMKFGIDPARWERRRAHVHYALAGPNGTTVYGATGTQKIESAGGDPAHPSASALVAAGIAKSAGDVRIVFAFPAIWDLTAWLIPNPDGAFADKNPDVKPVNAKPMSM